MAPAGAKALFLLLSGDLHATGANPADIIGEAAAGGVRRVVLLSTPGVVTRPSGQTRVAMRALEDLLREPGLEWVILGAGRLRLQRPVVGRVRPRASGRRRALW